MNCSRCKTYTANYTFNPKRTVSSPAISARARDIILVDMYIAQVESDRLQGKFYLPRHQVQVVNIGRQPEVRVTATLVADRTSSPPSNWNCTRLKQGAWLLSAPVSPVRNARSSCCCASPG